MLDETVGIFNNGVSLYLICLSQHLIVSDISQLKGLPISVAVLDWKVARNAVEATVEVVLRAPQCLVGTIEVDNDRVLVDQL